MGNYKIHLLINFLHIIKKYFRELHFLLMFPFFIILHGYNELYELLPLSVIITLTVKYVSITLLLALGTLITYKDHTKAFLFTSFLLSVYFFFGSFHDWLKLFFHNSKLSSYSLILPGIFLITLAIGIYLLQTSMIYNKLVSFLKVLLLILAIWEIGSFISNLVRHTHTNNNLILLSNELLPSHVAIQEKPDIFFVVFDEYTSSSAMRDYLNHDNYSIDSIFNKHQFYISGNSKSNYNLTPFSLSSTFGLNYLHIPSDPYTISPKDLLKAIYSVDHNPLIPFLRAEGYNIKNFGCLDFADQKTKQEPYFNYYFKNAIDNQTLTSRIYRDIWWNFKLRIPFSQKIRIPSSYKKNKENFLERNFFNYEGLVKELKTESDMPKFVYSHLILPHEPFFLKANGTFFSDTAILKNTIEPRSGYINQVSYANRLIDRLVSLCDRKSKRKRVIIIEGDHGYRFYSDAVPEKKLFMNLNAYYFSDQDYSLLYDSISPVNSFRVVLKKYFNCRLPLLRDSSTYLIDPQYDNGQK